MSTDVHESRANDSGSPGVSMTTILFGLILLTLGLLWLLDAGGAISVTWTLVGSVMLIVIGVLLIAAARHGSHEGMIFIGISLSVIVVFGSLASWPSFEGGVGENDIAPADLSELKDEYQWSVGEQDTDFSNVEFPEGTTSISIQLGTGNLKVLIPDDIEYRVDWNIGIGNAEVLGRSGSGLGVDGRVTSDDYEAAARSLELEIQVGIGAVEVRR